MGGAGSVAAEKVKLSRTPTLKIKVLCTILKTDGALHSDDDDGNDLMTMTTKTPTNPRRKRCFCGWFDGNGNG